MTKIITSVVSVLLLATGCAKTPAMSPEQQKTPTNSQLATPVETTCFSEPVAEPAGWNTYINKSSNYQFRYPDYLGDINPGNGGYRGPLSSPEAQDQQDLVIVNKQGQRILSISVRPADVADKNIGAFPGINATDLYSNDGNQCNNGVSFQLYQAKAEVDDDKIIYRTLYKGNQYTVSLSNVGLGNIIFSSFKFLDRNDTASSQSSTGPNVVIQHQELIQNSTELALLKTRKIQPFLDYYATTNDPVLSLTITVPNMGGQYMMKAVFTSGGYAEGEFGLREKDLGYWVPDCMHGPCKLPMSFKKKYPEIVRLQQ